MSAEKEDGMSPQRPVVYAAVFIGVLTIGLSAFSCGREKPNAPGSGTNSLFLSVKRDGEAVQVKAHIESNKFLTIKFETQKEKRKMGLYRDNSGNEDLRLQTRDNSLVFTREHKRDMLVHFNGKVLLSEAVSLGENEKDRIEIGKVDYGNDDIQPLTIRLGSEMEGVPEHLSDNPRDGEEKQRKF